MKMKRKKIKINKDFWLWFGGAALVLILIISLIVVPAVSNNQPETSTPAETTTEKITEPETTESETESKTTKTSEPTSTHTPTSTPESKPDPDSGPAPTQTSPKPSTVSSCYHEEAGRCWDDLEDEAYSAGQYDREFGYYGATLEYADDCDALCREIIEDAYDEGWYDY